MHSLIEKLFKKRGIEDVRELTEEEKRDFDNWNSILSKDELTIVDVKEFCRSQCEIIKAKWSDYETSQAKKAEMIPYFTVYNTLLNAIEAPKASREALEKQLNLLLNS